MWPRATKARSKRLRTLLHLGNGGLVKSRRLVKPDARRIGQACRAGAAFGGLATWLLVPQRPASASAAPIRPRALGSIWAARRLRASVFGYFGHMWELYAFIVLVPTIVASRLASSVTVSAASFWVIGAGCVGCVGGGLLARRFGSARVAQSELATSALCCLAAPLMLVAPLPLFFVWLLVWGRRWWAIRRSSRPSPRRTRGKKSCR